MTRQEDAIWRTAAKALEQIAKELHQINKQLERLNTQIYNERAKGNDDQLRDINKELYQANKILENQNKNRRLCDEWIWGIDMNNSTNMEDDLK